MEPQIQLFFLAELKIVHPVRFFGPSKFGPEPGKVKMRQSTGDPAIRSINHLSLIRLGEARRKINIVGHKKRH